LRDQTEAVFRSLKKISKASIKNIFPSDVYRRGLTYYNEERVHGLSYDLNHHVWTASVTGSIDYFVEINLVELNKGTVKAYCECPAFVTYGTCKHIVAVLLAISYQKSQTYSLEQTKQFIDGVLSTKQRAFDLETLLQKRPLHVEYFLIWTDEGFFHIELKIGVHRSYVVKDLASFLNDVQHHREHFFTQKFTYSPKIHYFLREDIAILNMLHHIIKNERIYQYLSISKDNRSLMIPPYVIEDLLMKLVARDLTVYINTSCYKHVNIVTDGLPYQFYITQTDENMFMFHMPNKSNIIYLPSYELLFSEGIFYVPTDEQVPFLKHIHDLHTDALAVSSEQMHTFVSDIVPTLQRIAHVHIDRDVKERMIQAPLQAKLYLELKDRFIIGQLTYQYDHYTINPFTEKNDSDVIIVRQRKKEEQIMRFIEDAQFKYNGKVLYIEVDDESLYHFLYKVLPTLAKHVELILTPRLKKLIVAQNVQPNTFVRYDESAKLLDINFDISGIDEADIQKVLQAVVEKKRFVRLMSGAFLPLEDEKFSQMKHLLEELNVDSSTINNHQLQVPTYRSMQVADVLNEQNYDLTFQRLLKQLQSPQKTNDDIPSNLQATLRPYQKLGYQWFKSLSDYHLGGILADDMGLGKTVQTIAYLLSEPNECIHLVIAPSSVVYNWKYEFNRFAPSLQVAVMTGTKDERQQKVNTLTHMDVWITSYATMRQDIGLYKHLTFHALILDEAQYIKNFETKTSQAIQRIQAKRRFALSGTPIENSVDELWSIFQVILPGFMPNRRQFKQLPYEKIARLTKPFILRRLREDVLTELPGKIETIHISELTKEQKQLYLGYLRKLQDEATHVLKHQPFHQERMKILAGLTRLRQICCHPSLFIDNYTGTSGKLEQLIETVKSSIEQGKRMLIFSQFTSMLHLMTRRLNKEGIDYFYLHGQTPAKERLKMSEQFNAGEKSVFLISLRAGGTGLNLTGADTVILYDLWWNPAVEDQAMARAHRFGQKDVVQVIRMVAEGTIEEKIYHLQQKKRALIDEVVKPGEMTFSTLSEEDIRMLLNI